MFLFFFFLKRAERVLCVFVISWVSIFLSPSSHVLRGLFVFVFSMFSLVLSSFSTKKSFLLSTALLESNVACMEHVFFFSFCFCFVVFFFLNTF